MIPVNDLVRLEERAVAVRRRRLGQDGDGRVHLAARQRRRSGRHLLGPSPRAVDAQPGSRPAEPDDLLGMAADIMEAAGAKSPDDLFLRMEDAGVMLRIDRP